jgi:hypothetical protein
MRLAVSYARMSVLSPSHPNWVEIQREDSRVLGGRTIDQILRYVFESALLLTALSYRRHKQRESRWR